VGESLSSHNLRSRSAADQRGSLRTRRSQVQFLPGAPLSPRSPTRRRRSAQNGDSAGANPAVGTTFPPCSPTSRGAPLKKEKLRVQILPGGPLLALVAQLAEAANLRSALCRCKSDLEHFFWSMYRTSEPGLGANEISRRLLTGVQVLRAPLYRP
jgi:hypothetical protein